MKREIKIFFSFISVLLVGLFVVGCNHPHTYSDDWTYNETYHWHSSTCEHKDELREKALHSFTEWVTDEEATEKKMGQKSRTCTVCGYKEIEYLDKIIHEHTYSEEWSSNNEKHWHSSTCVHDLKADEGNHEWNEWEIIKEESYLEDGLKKTSCKVCGKEKEETIPQRTYMTSSEFKSLVIDKINKNSGTVSYKKNDLEAKVQFGNNLVKLINEDVTIYQVKDEKLYSISKLNDTWFAKEEDITSKVYTDLIDNISVNKVLDYLFESDKSIVDLLKSDFVTYTYNSETGLYQVSISDDLDKTNLDKLEGFVSHIQYSKYEVESLTFGIKNEEGEAIEELNINSDSNITLPEKIYNLAFTQDGEDGHYHMSYNGNNEEKFGHEEHHYGELIVDENPKEDVLGEHDGYGHKVCSDCGYVLENVVIPHEAHVHDWGEWKITLLPTYSTTGRYTRVCTKNENHTDSLNLPLLTDEKYVKTYELVKGVVLEKVSYKLTISETETTTITFEKEYDIVSFANACDGCAVEGIIYFDSKDYYLLEDLDSNPTFLLNDFEFDGNIKNFDKVTLFGLQTSEGFKVISILASEHPTYKIDVNEDVKVIVDENNYVKDSSVLFNGTEYKFEFILNSNEITISHVEYTNAKSDKKIVAEVSEDNKYLITIYGDTKVYITIAYVFDELTKDTVLDFDNYQYDIAIMAFNNMFDGSLDKSKMTSNNIVKNGSESRFVQVNNNKALLEEDLLKSTFTLDKALNNKFIIKSSSGLYIGATSNKSASLGVNAKEVYYSDLSFDSNGNIVISYDEFILEYNIDANVFKYYKGTQKQIRVFYKAKAYTDEEKATRNDFIATLELNYVKSTFESSYIVLEEPLSITIDSKAVVASIKDDGTTGATIKDNVLTIPVQKHNEAKTITLTLTAGTKEETVTISIPQVESKTAKEAFDLIATYENGVYSDTLYFVTGIVKDIIEESKNSTSLEIYTEGNEADVVKVYNLSNTASINKFYKGDTVTAVGYLQKFVKDDATTPEVTSNKSTKVNVQVVSRTAGDATISFNVPTEYEDKVHIYNGTNEIFLPVPGKNGDVLEFTVVVDDLRLNSIKIGETLLTKENGKYRVEFDNNKIIDITATGITIIPGYRQVTNVSELDSSSKYILVVKSLGVINDSYNSGKYLNKRNVEFVSESIVNGIGIDGSEVSYLTLVPSESGWKLKTIDNKYINGADSGNYLKLEDDVEKAQVWSISFNENGYVIISYVDSKTYYIKYNSGSPRFSRYDNSGELELFKYASNNEVLNTDLDKYTQLLLDELKTKFNDKSYSETTEIEVNKNAVISDISISMNSAEVDNVTDPYVTFADGKLKVLRTNTSTEYDMIVTFDVSVKVYYANNTKYVEKTANNVTITLLKNSGSSQKEESKDITYVFDSKSWTTTSDTNNWVSGKDGGFTKNQGVQVTTSKTGANAKSTDSFNKVSKVIVTYCTNSSNGAGDIVVKIGQNEEKSLSVTKTGGTTLRTITYDYETTQDGQVEITVNCTTNSIYIYSVQVFYESISE